MSRIFISYRHADTGQVATKLYRHISMRFGKDMVFQDVDDIRPGDDFVDTIRDEIASCEVFLVLIGVHWLVDEQGQRRLDDPNDILCMEVSEAFAHKATILPLLIGEAHMPASAALPKSIQQLSRHQALSLSEDNWIPNVEALIERLRELILPRPDDEPLPKAEAELYELQLKYFDLLETENAADALELAQKTQAYLDRVLPLYPQVHNLKLTRGYLFKNEAMALLRLGREQEATRALNQGETIFNTMLDELPNDAGALNGMGSIEAIRGNFTKAHEYVDEALKIIPDYPAALQDHQMILQYLGLATCEVIESIKKRKGREKIE